jgi:hypothetical protein
VKDESESGIIKRDSRERGEIVVRFQHLTEVFIKF